MKTDLLKDESPDRPQSRQLTPWKRQGHADYFLIGPKPGNQFHAYIGENTWGCLRMDPLGLATELPQAEGFTNPPTPRVLEAELVEDQIKRGVAMFFNGPATHLTSPVKVDVGALISKHKETLGEIHECLGRIERALEDAVKEIERLRSRDRTIWAPIESLAPNPYELSRPITVVLTSTGDEFEASFFDANLHGAGDTEEEAISDLKTIIVETVERLNAMQDDKLGPAMIKQKQILHVYVRKREE